MRVLPRVRADDEAGDVNVVRLKVFGQAVAVDDGLVGDAVVADEGVGEDEDLAAVGGVGEGLGVADHAGVEDDLAGDGGVGAEGPCLEGGRAIGQVQVGLGALLLYIHASQRFARIEPGRIDKQVSQYIHLVFGFAPCGPFSIAIAFLPHAPPHRSLKQK